MLRKSLHLARVEKEKINLIVVHMNVCFYELSDWLGSRYLNCGWIENLSLLYFIVWLLRGDEEAPVQNTEPGHEPYLCSASVLYRGAGS